MKETLQKRFRHVLKQLRDESSTWRPHWRDISENMMPRKGRFLGADSTKQDTNKGTKKHQKIINGTASDSLRILAAGMQGGLTSPSRPWFVLSLPDKNLMEFEPVKYWLTDVRNSMLNVFSRSNFYGSVHTQYMELGGFGSAAMLIEEDFKTVISCRPFTIGEYYIALDENYRPSMLYRVFAMKARQMVAKFGEANVSQAVKTAVNDSNKGEQYFDVVHCITPNEVDSGVSDMFSYMGAYFELAGEQGDNDNFLAKYGYRTLPFVAPRWEVTGVDTYGECPGMLALGDVKMLQKMEEKKLKALDKIVDPPMNAHPSLKKRGPTIVSGGVNYIDPSINPSQSGFSPAYQVNLNVRDVGMEIERVENRIRRFFFNDLFLSILATDKRMTATEVAERHEEKLLMLGPVIERIQSEFLDPMIDRTYSIMESFGLIPPPPSELQGMQLKVEYVSVLAQAQKLVGVNALERTANFVGAMTGLDQGARHKFDVDEAIDEYAESVGASPRVIRSAVEANKRRQAEQQQIARAQALEQAKTLSEAGKNASETRREEGTALDAIMGAAGQ